MFIFELGITVACPCICINAAIFAAEKHYENTPMQYTAIFHGDKNDNFQLQSFGYFHIFAQNICCGYTLETPH